MRKLTTGEWVEKAIAVHGDRFDYSYVNYTGNKEPVEIVCQNHGVFHQLPSVHLRSKDGCSACAAEALSAARKEPFSVYLEKARKVHGDKFTYIEETYKGSQKRLTIICPIHGKFEQVATTHLQSKHGCAKCGVEASADERSLGQEGFLKKAREVHGDRYCYDKAVFRSLNYKVVVICRIHGEFEQSANHHTQGGNCPICANEESAYTRDEWISRAVAIHGDKYDYSKALFERSYIKSTIICPEHGEFEQSATNHVIIGYGCKRCGDAMKGRALEQDEFIAKAKQIHGESYDYSGVEYVNTRTPVSISCAKGHSFDQVPNLHLQGAGCPTCALEGRIGKVYEVKELPTVERLLEKFDYSRDEGVLRYRESLKAVVKGQVAGWIGPGGYRLIEIDGTAYLASRLIAHLEGYEVSSDVEIDHINGVTDDNRISNLRVTDHSGNQRNRRLSDLNRFGCPGISERGGKFRVSIRDNGKSVWRGPFDTLKEAIEARKEAEKELGYHENHGKTAEERAKFKA